jgi:hypothetical protein
VIAGASAAIIVVGGISAALVDSVIGRVAIFPDAVMQSAIFAYTALYETGIMRFLDSICSFITCDNSVYFEGGANTQFNSIEALIPQSLKDAVGGSVGGATIGSPTTCQWLQFFLRYSLAPENMDSGLKFRNDPVWQGHVNAFTSTSVLELSKKSWIFSIGCLCLPGIVYNLNKIRQTRCWKAVCYRDYIPTGLYTRTDCDDINNYNWCVYGAGQVTVFLDILAAPLKAVVNIFKHPGASALMIGWSAAKETAHGACGGAELACLLGGLGTCSLTWDGGCGTYSIMTLVESIFNGITVGDNLVKFFINMDPDEDFAAAFQQQEDHCGRLLGS